MTLFHQIAQRDTCVFHFGRSSTHIAALTAVMVSLLASSAARAAGPPNIVMILADDLSWVDTSVQMHPNLASSKSDFHQTPRLEQLAAQGMRFSDAYSAAPVCAPTRAALLTGRSPAQLQMADLSFTHSQPGGSRWTGHYAGLPLTPPVPEPIQPDVFALPQLIKQTNPNYATGIVGKWHLATTTEVYPQDVGYDYYAGVRPFPSDEVDPWGVFKTANLSNAFMEQHVAANQPFYLEVTPYAVHAPIRSRQEIRDKYAALPPGTKHKGIPYAAMTEDLDTSIGMILDKIQELGIADNTYILFTSDNGGATNYTSNAPLYRGKASVYEGGIRVPTIVSGPGIAANTFSQIPISTVDFFATIADLVGFSGPLPNDVEGASLMPILDNGGVLPNDMDHLSRNFTEGGELYWHWPYNFGPGPNYRIRPQSAVRDGDYKLFVEWGENGAPDNHFLFNLAANVSETGPNLASAMPEKTAELRAKLDNYLAAIDASYAYDVKEPATMNWDASQVGNVPEGWRSTIDLKYKGRETWTKGGGTEAPQVVPSRAYQPGIADQAFHFDGDDVMRKHYFHVGDERPRRSTKPSAGVGDFDRSTSMEFWVRLDSLAQNQVLFESGDASKGLSLTLGDGDSDGLTNDLRFRIRGLTGADEGDAGVTKELEITAKIDRFANPVADFVHLAAVFNDDPTNRYAEIYVNGALAGRVNGLSGVTESIMWDGFDMAGLGNVGGDGLGAAGGSGNLPFAGGGLRGSMALMRFNNFSINSSTVLDRYNSFLDPVMSGIAATMGDAVVPSARPAHVSLGAAESSVLNVMHERNDVLDQALMVDAIVNGPLVLSNGSTPMADFLAAGTAFSSYLLHFDPLSSSATIENALGAINFRGEILAVLWDSATLADTDTVLGSIGNYGDQADRGMDFSTAGVVAISADQHTLSFDLDVLGNQMLQFRVLTTTVNGADFNGDGLVNGTDLAIWQNGFGRNASGDANGDGTTDGRDFLIWQREMSSPATGLAAVPEPSSLLLIATVTLSLGLRRRWA